MLRYPEHQFSLASATTDCQQLIRMTFTNVRKHHPDLKGDYGKITPSLLNNILTYSRQLNKYLTSISIQCNSFIN